MLLLTLVCVSKAERFLPGIYWYVVNLNVVNWSRLVYHQECSSWQSRPSSVHLQSEMQSWYLTKK